MANFKTYDSVGIKEDVSDVIDQLPDTDTAFADSLGSRNVATTLYKWQTSALLKGADNARIEGADAVDDELASTNMLMNTTQIMSRTINLSGSLEKTDHHGRKNEYARQLIEKGKQLRQDFEFACIGRAPGVPSAMNLGSGTVARRFASAFGLVAAENVIDNGGGALAETTVKKVIRKAYDVGANVTTLLMNPAVADQTAGFKGNAQNTREVTAAKATVSDVVRVYITAHGTISFEMARNMHAGTALAMRKGTYRRAVFRPWEREVLGKTGDSKRTQLLGEYGLQIDNDLGAFVVTGILPDAE